MTKHSPPAIPAPPAAQRSPSTESERSPSTDSAVHIVDLPVPKKKRSLLHGLIASAKTAIRFPLHHHRSDESDHSDRSEREDRYRGPVGLQAFLAYYNTVNPATNIVPDQLVCVDVEMDLKFESPPITLFGRPSQSAGAVFSGLLDIKIGKAKTADRSETSDQSAAPPSRFEVGSLQVKIIRQITIHPPHPPSASNSKCSSRTYRQTVKCFSYPRTEVQSGQTINYPVSHFFAGDSIATVDHQYCQIRHFVQTSLTLNQHDVSSFSSLAVLHTKPAVFERELVIHRSILSVSEVGCVSNTITSIRDIMSTRIQVHVQRPLVCFPTSTINLTFTVKNLEIENDDRIGRPIPPPVVPAGSYRRWTIHQLRWRIEQVSQIDRPVCHSQPDIPSPNQSVQSIYSGVLRDDWNLSHQTRYPSGNPQYLPSIQASLSTTIQLDPTKTQLQRKYHHQHSVPEIGFSVKHRLEMAYILFEQIVTPNPTQNRSESFVNGQYRTVNGPTTRSTGSSLTIRFGVGLDFTEKPIKDHIVSWDEDVAPAYSSKSDALPDYPNLPVHHHSSTPPEPTSTSASPLQRSVGVYSPAHLAWMDDPSRDGNSIPPAYQSL